MQVQTSTNHLAPGVETWLPVVGYEGRYEVSDRGRVKSLVGRLGVQREKILKPWAHVDGYLLVNLWKNDLGKTHRVHRIALQAFIGPPLSEKHEAAHLDGVRNNNVLTNLQWKTHVENEADKVIHGTLLFGEAHGATKLPDDQIDRIFDLHAKGYPQMWIAKLVGCSQNHISRVLSGENRSKRTFSTHPEATQ